MGSEVVYPRKMRNSTVLLNNAAITSTTSWTYQPFENKISILVHITAVSGTSPTLNMYVYAIDPNGNVLTNSPVASGSQITSATDQILNIDLYGINQIQITAQVGGTSPSFTGTISVVE